MAQNFLSCDRDQVLLLAPDLGEWLPAGHLARFVIETVGQLDLAAVYGYYRRDGHGRPAHDPGMMVALVLYNYAVGVTSSRAIERRCVDDVACRVITANRQPDHATIARFLVRHRDALSGLFFEVLALCHRAGMVRVGIVAVDSTKLASNASANQNRTYEGLREEAARIIEEALETDRREDELYGEARGDELPDDLADPRTRKARIKELLEEVRRRAEEIEVERERQRTEMIAAPQTPRRRGGRPSPRPGLTKRELDRLARMKINATDPDSGVVRHRGMLLQGYNVQTAVSDGQVILATTISGVSSDGGQLQPTIERAAENLARIGITEPIEQVLADSGYWQTKQIKTLQDSGLDVLVPPQVRARSMNRANQEVQAMSARLATEDGQRDYRRRQQIVEPVFAHIKHARQITRVLRRGKAAVQAEVDLIATTHNLLKLHRQAALATG